MILRPRIAAAVAAIAALLLPAVAAHAQSQQPSQPWPTRSVKFILPLGAGSGADIGARLLAEKLSTKWGQAVVVENRPGGDGFVAITAFTGANDDHVLLFGPASAFVAHPYLHQKLPYDPKDLSPVVQISNTVVSIASPASFKANTLKELFDEARANPGKLNWATITGVTDFIMAGFLKANNLDMAKVPYKNPVQALTDLAENRIQYYNAAYAITRPQIQAGKIKLLAVTNTERAPVIKDTPTVAEAGVPGLSFDGLVGIYGPRDMPADRREKIAADVEEAVKDPAVFKRLEDTAQIVRPGGPKVFAASIEKMRESIVATAKILDVKPAQ
jgi:tripartite-type tricarboxylate transporter receptor subunit TctC